MHAPVRTSLWGHPWQGPRGQPVPAWDRMVWISSARREEPALTPPRGGGGASLPAETREAAAGLGAAEETKVGAGERGASGGAGAALRGLEVGLGAGWMGVLPPQAGTAGRAGNCRGL